MNRTQALVLGFAIFSWMALVAILVGAPDVYDSELRPLGLAGLPFVRLAFLALVTSLLVVLATGTLRRWRDLLAGAGCVRGRRAATADIRASGPRRDLS